MINLHRILSVYSYFEHSLQKLGSLKKDSVKVDFHIHTNYSDGEFTIDEVLADADSKSLDIIAITDHNSIQGYINIAENYFTSELQTKGLACPWCTDNKINQLLHRTKK